MGDYLELAQLWAQFEARTRMETAHWRRCFTQRLQANGYRVAENNARAPDAFTEMWTQRRGARKDQLWAGVVAAVDQALADEVLDTFRMNGVEITDKLKVRNLRYKIEQALVRDLMSKANRKRLFHLRDWFSPEDQLLNMRTRPSSLRVRHRQAVTRHG